MAPKPTTRGQSAESGETPSMQFLMPPASLDSGQSTTEVAEQEIQFMPVSAFDLQSVNVNILSSRVYQLMLSEAKNIKNRTGRYDID